MKSSSSHQETTIPHRSGLYNQWNLYHIIGLILLSGILSKCSGSRKEAIVLNEVEIQKVMGEWQCVRDLTLSSNSEALRRIDGGERTLGQLLNAVAVVSKDNWRAGRRAEVRAGDRTLLGNAEYWTDGRLSITTSIDGVRVVLWFSRDGV